MTSQAKASVPMMLSRYIDRGPDQDDKEDRPEPDVDHGQNTHPPFWPVFARSHPGPDPGAKCGAQQVGGNK